MTDPKHSPRAQNDAYLFRQWAAAGLPLAFTLIGFGAMLRSGETRWLTVASLGISVALIWAIVWWQHGKFERALRQPGPEAYIQAALSHADRLPKLRAQLEAGAAFGAALYEQGDLAERHLGAVRWEDEPPLARASSEIARALVHYGRGEWSEGWARARHASALGAVDPRLPGARTSELAFDMNVALGAVLADRTNGTTRGTLEAGFQKLPLTGKLLAAWALWILAQRSGAAEEANAFAAFITERAPHCALLRRIPDANEP